MVAVQLAGVSFAYNRKVVLENIDLTIEAGDFLGVIGPNGGGKTTLLRLILGLLSPDRGCIRVLGEKPCRLSHRMGYVPQNGRFDESLPVSLLDVVLMGSVHKYSFGPCFSNTHRRKALDVLAAVEMAGLIDAPFCDLSGGQKQRVLLARALISDPLILILDEPTASVDFRLEADIYELLRRLNERMTIILVSHDLGFVSSFVNKIACLNRTLVCRPVEEVDAEMVAQTYHNAVRMIRHSCEI